MNYEDFIRPVKEPEQNVETSEEAVAEETPIEPSV